MSAVLRPTSSCVDVGCHAGGILRQMIAFAPDGRHFAFEPIPDLAAGLRREFPGVQVFEVALSDESGMAEFKHVTSRPGYSGLRERAYPTDHETVQTIQVRTERLDDLLPPDASVDFMKVDVEGGELAVFRGATRTIETHRPYIVFEHGLGAAEFYGTTPQEVYDLLVERCGLRISLLDAWLGNKPPLTRDAFAAQFYEHRNFYFLAHPEDRPAS